jgi:hypothetical protein
MRRQLAALAATLVMTFSAPVLAQSNQVVVELYTSQGCSSCPPADKILTKLAARDDVIALALHVDYWDYLGWKDVFGSPRNTQRQRNYAHARGSKSIYTPQVVVQGVGQGVGSRKGDEMAANPLVALCFHWQSIGRQVRIEGAIEAVDTAEADAYFASRPRGSQLGAWASHQSQPLAHRADLVARIAEFDERFADTPITRPPFWSGYRVIPSTMEFWRHGDDRLHERLRFDRGLEQTWTTQYLYP